MKGVFENYANGIFLKKYNILKSKKEKKKEKNYNTSGRIRL